MKVKLDDYEVRVLINGLIQQHRSYDAETNGQIDALALRLCDIAEARSFFREPLRLCLQRGKSRLRNTKNCSERNTQITTLCFVTRRADRWKIKL